jgi:hypothetical protein
MTTVVEWSVHVVGSHLLSARKYRESAAAQQAVMAKQPTRIARTKLRARREEELGTDPVTPRRRWGYEMWTKCALPMQSTQGDRLGRERELCRHRRRREPA